MRQAFRAHAVDTAQHWISRVYTSVAPLRLALCTGPRFFTRLQDADVFYVWNSVCAQVPAERFLALVEAEHFTWPPPPQTYREPPVVDAYLTTDHPASLVLWCAFCESWHRHGSGRVRGVGVGSGDGHRHAHCYAHNQPFRTPWAGCGYILREVGTMTDAAMKQYARAQALVLKTRHVHIPCGCTVCQWTPDNPCTVRYWPHSDDQCTNRQRSTVYDTRRPHHDPACAGY